jgi:hypothetical protein
VSWWQYAILGAVGGALVEALSLLNSVTAWQNGRRAATGELKTTLPGWKIYVDMPVQAWLLLIRAPLGAAAALLFGLTGQISGAYAAVALGFAAPAVLAQLGSIAPTLASAAVGVEPRKEAAGGTGVDSPGQAWETWPTERGGAT